MAEDIRLAKDSLEAPINGEAIPQFSSSSGDAERSYPQITDLVGLFLITCNHTQENVMAEDIGVLKDSLEEPINGEAIPRFSSSSDDSEQSYPQVINPPAKRQKVSPGRPGKPYLQLKQQDRHQEQLLNAAAEISRDTGSGRDQKALLHVKPTVC